MSVNRGLPSIVDPVFRPGEQPSAKRMDQNDRLVRGIQGEGSTLVSYRNGKIIISAGAAGMDYSKFCFGFKISGATVTIMAGEIEVGTVTHALAETNFTITADYQYIGVSYTIGAAAFIGPSTNVAIFRSDTSTMKKWLYQFRYTPPVAPATIGTASLHRVGRIGNIGADGNFA